MKEIPERGYTAVDMARAFSIAAHSGVAQKRKYTGEDYSFHPESVLRILCTYTDAPVKAQCAALLHDIIEDTSVKHEHIAYVFGIDVADMVVELTDVSRIGDGNRARRKALDRNHLACSSYWGASIKLADLIDNSQSIVRHDPKFAEVFMEEMKALLEVLSHGNERLFHVAKMVVDDYYKTQEV